MILTGRGVSGDEARQMGAAAKLISCLDISTRAEETPV